MSKLRSAAIAAGFIAVGGYAHYDYSRSIGYINYTQEDGSNILCDIDPLCRKLHNDEASLARTIFGDVVDYSQVNVFEGLSSHTTLTPQEQAETYAAVKLGNMYITPLFRESSSFTRRSVFIHEMAHVWQYQNGVTYDQSIEDYGYSFPFTAPLESHGVEQQASIIQNLFAYRIMFEASPTREECEIIAGHERLLQRHIPVGKTRGCTV